MSTGTTMDPKAITVVEGHNPRGKGKPVKPDKELCASIEQLGILQPLLVTPEGQLIAGNRRLAAALALELTEVPVLIRDQRGDESAAALAENIQRKDLDPWDEAAKVHELLSKGADLERISAALGWSAQKTARRAALLELAPEIQKQLAAKPKKGRSRSRRGSSIATWSVAALEEIAALEHSTQLEVVDRIGWDDPEVSRVREVAAEFSRTLSSATWKLDDADLVPKQGACTDCTRHSKAVAGLFDEERPETIAKARCLDSACWRQKLMARAELRHAEALAAAKGPLVYLESSDDVGRRRRSAGKEKTQVDIPKGAKVIGRWDVNPAKANAKGAVQAFVVSGKDAGKTRWVKLGSYADKASKDAVKKAAKSKGKGDDKPAPGSAQDLRQKRARLARRREAWMIDAVREQVQKQTDHPPLDMLCRLVAHYGAHSGNGEHYRASFGSAVPKKPDYRPALWKGVKGHVTGELRRVPAQHARQYKLARWVWENVVTPKALPKELQDRAEEAIPVPKSLLKYSGAGAKRKPAAKKRAKKKASPARTRKATKKKPAKRRKKVTR